MSSPFGTALAAAAAAAAAIALVFAGAPAAGDGGYGATLASGPDMHRDRIAAAVTNLPGGRVAVFGGHGGGSFAALGTAEVWSEAGGWHELTMNSIHDFPAFARLADGRFLIAGGSYDLGVPAVADAEIFDPSTELFASIPSMWVARAGCGAATLTSGKVLVVGGWYGDMAAGYGEVWDPGTGEWTMTEPLVTPRAYPLVVPCDDGTAIVFSGMSPYGSTAYASAEVYDPGTNTFSALGSGVLTTGGLTPEVPDGVVSIWERRIADGRYLFIAWRDVGGTVEHVLFTVDPATKEFAALPVTSSLATGVGYYGPLVDRAGDKAYVTLVDQPGTGFAWTAVDLVTGQIQAATATTALPNDQYMSYAARTVLPDGRLFIAGGYHLRVMTNYAGSMSLTLATPDAMTVPTPPAVPADLLVVAEGGTTSWVTWTHDPPSEDGFRVERRQLPAGTWSEVAAPGPDGRAFEDTGLHRGAAYEYHVCAFNAAGASDWTPAVAVTMPGGRCVAARALSFGTIRVGATRRRSVLVRNTHTKQAMAVRVVGVTGPFAESIGSIVTEPWTTIAKRKSVRIRVTFTPLERGLSRGVLTLETTDAKHPTISVKLSGRATKPRRW